MEPTTPPERLPLIALLAILMGALPERCEPDPPATFEPLYQVQITRMAQTDAEQALIARAEAHCPPYEDVAAVWETAPPPPGPDCLWHHPGIYGLSLPYAITSGALDYYAARIQEQEAQGARVRTFLTYTAQVKTPPFDDGAPAEAAVAVDMRLSYSIIECLEECGIGVLKRRLVYFDADGVIVAVMGDGPAEFLEAR